LIAQKKMSINFAGIWNADLGKSRLLGACPRAISVRIEHWGLELKQEILVTKLDGEEDRVSFKCCIDSEDHCLLNGKPIRGSARWVGEELLIESWIQLGDREVHFCDFWSLSPDGQTLTMEHRDDHLAGQITIFDRVG
jgi:hypothetical protein